MMTCGWQAVKAAARLRRSARNGQFSSVAGQRGFTLLELVVVVIVVSILFLAALDKMWTLQTTAERATMEYNIGALRSALALQFVARIVRKDEEGIRQLAGSNPMTLLNQIPGNYLGEFAGVDPATLERGNWYFDRRQKMLIYLVKNSHFFRSSLSGPPRVRWLVELDYAVSKPSSGSGPLLDRLEGISLRPMESYVWREEDRFITGKEVP